MSKHLIAFSIGPVQEFIAAARRTRDLWFGSYMLSEISKAVAKAVQDSGARLIFPAPENDDNLKPDSSFNVANIILAEVEGMEPETIAQSAKKAAQDRWRQFADLVFKDKDCHNWISHEIWNDQVDDVIEFYSAWIPWAEDYAKARASLMRLLAGRKNCRDFKPGRGRWGVPKSSLDGLRETVLVVEKDKRDKKLIDSLRLQDGEQLDVVGLVKRMSGGNKHYPSVARVAADQWIRKLSKEDLNRLVAECGGLCEKSYRLDAARYPQYKDFRFDGTLIFQSRHASLVEEGQLAEHKKERYQNILRSLVKKYGEPSAYLAVLVADGDRMGEMLSGISNAEEHRGFSQDLSSFANKSSQIVSEHQGVLVYSGGDDVLAFVPVDKSLSCARSLYSSFNDTLAKGKGGASTDPTLSIGLAIAHFMEPLEDLLRFGREAEKHAKNPGFEDDNQKSRDGLAIHLHKRGGVPLVVRDNWAFTGWCENTLRTLQVIHPLGGERRLVSWRAGVPVRQMEQTDTKEESSCWDCPHPVAAALNNAKRIRMLLTTPAIFAHGWRPAWLNNELCGRPPGTTVQLKLVGLSIARWQPISGWSLAAVAGRKRGAKPSRRMVPAGGVYFFEVMGGDGADLKSLWLKSVSDDEQDRRDGFGLAVWGIW